MKKTLLILLSLVFVVSCSTNTEKIKIKPGAIFLDVDTLHPKQPFTMYYNTKDNEAVFKDGNDSLYVRLLCYKDDFIFQYKLQLQKSHSDTNILYTKFILPDSTCFTKFSVMTVNRVFKLNEKNYIVYPISGIPTHRSLMFKFSRQPENQAEYNYIVKTDTSYYGNYTDLSSILWQHISDTNVIRRNVEQYEAIYKKLKDSLDYLSTINMLSCISYGNYMVGNVERSRTYLDECEQYIKDNISSHKEKPCFDFNLEDLLNLMFQNNFLSCSEIQMNPTKQKIFDDLLSIAVMTNNNELVSYILLYTSPMEDFVKKNRLSFQKVVSYISDNFLLHLDINMEKHLVAGIGMLFDCNTLYIALGKEKETLKLLELGNYIFDKYNKFGYSKDTNDLWLDNDTAERNLSSMYVDIGDYYLEEQKNPQEAAKYYHTVLRRFSNIQVNQGPISLSEIALCKIKIHDKDLDSADYYLCKAIEHKSPFSQETFNLLNAAKAKRGLDTLSFEEYVKKAKIKNRDTFESLANTYIKTDREAFSTGSLKDTLVFVYYVVDACVICNIGITQSLQILSELSIGHPYKILIVSDKKRQDLVAVWGKYIYNISRSSCPIQPKDANNREKTTFALIKNNQVLKSESIPQTKEEINEILK